MKKGPKTLPKKGSKRTSRPGAAGTRSATAGESARVVADLRLNQLELEKVLHDLHVHEVELETQNCELRETQLLLEAARDRFADLYDFAPVGYFTLDRRGLIREINLTAAGMLDRERARLIGQPFRTHVLKDDRDRYLNHIRSLRSSLAGEIELRLMSANGKTIHVRLTSTWSAGKTNSERPSIRAALSDIGAAKRAEHALRESEARLAAILDTATSGIITVDDRGTIELFNKAAEALFGYTAAEAIGQNICTLLHLPQWEEHAQCLWTGDRSEILGMRRDGTTFPLERSIGRVQLRDRCIFTVLLHDISMRRRLESELLEVTDSEQRRIGADLHDGLGQQLTALELECCLLMEQLDETKTCETSALVQDRLKHISDGLRECVTTTRTLAQGLVPANLQANGLAGALKQLAKSVGRAGSVKSRFICLRPPPQLPPLTEKHVYRIAQEAVNNAQKHSKMQRLTISLSRSGRLLRLVVADDGRGLQRTNRKSRGIGLDVMEHRAKLIGAVLEIESRAGHGTKVICAIPISADEDFKTN